VNVLGCDLSSRAIDLVLLDENENRASWTRIDLEGATAFERARDVAEKMPQPGWYEAHGVYLIAVEEPMGFQSRFLYRIQGAIIGALPREPVLWQVRPAAWKNALGLKQTQKPTRLSFGRPFSFIDGGSDATTVNNFADWPQDAYDALGVALYARDLNAQGIAARLGAA
jgi:hypothetical protein